MTKNLNIKQSETSRFQMVCVPYGTDTEYLFFIDKDLSVFLTDCDGFSVFDIVKIDFELCAFIESKVLKEIDRRRKTESLGYAFYLKH